MDTNQPANAATSTPGPSESSAPLHASSSSESKTRRWPWIAIVVVLVALAAGIVWAIGSGAVVEEIAEEAEDRLGLPLDFENLSLDEEGVTLYRVAAATPEGDVTLRAETLRLDADLLALRRRATGSIHGVTAEGAVLRFDLDHPAAADRVATLRRLAGLDGEDDALDDALDDGGATDDEDQSFDATGTLGTLLRLAKDDARFETSGTSIQVVEHGRERTLFDDLEVEVRRLEPAEIAELLASRPPSETEAADVSEPVLALHSRGSALTHGAGGHGATDRGTIAWNVQTAPAERTLRGAFDWLGVSLAPLARYEGSLPAIRDLERTRTGGRMQVATADGETLRLVGRLDLEGLTVENARLAEAPVTDLDLTFDGDAVVHRSARRVEIERGVVRRGDAALAATGSVYFRPAAAEGSDGEARAAYGADLDLELAKTSCQSVVDAIPSAILGPYEGFELTGTMRGTMELYVASSNLDKTRLDIEVDESCRFERVPQQATLEHIDGPFTHQVRGHDEVVFTLHTGPGTSAWTPLDQISPFMVHAVLAHEDAGFFGHDGFAVYAIEAALERNLREGEVVLGASTVSMQLAKNFFLQRDKTLARKAREAVLTWWLESSLTKGEILELYLNIIEYGPDVYGLRHAARHYFQTVPADLTPAQSVFLASLLPSPWVGQEQLEEGALSPHFREQMRFLLRHMTRKQRIDREALRYGLDEIDRFAFDAGPATGFMGSVGELPIVTASLPRAPVEPEILRYAGPESHRLERELRVAGSGTTVRVETVDAPSHEQTLEARDDDLR